MTSHTSEVQEGMKSLTYEASAKITTCKGCGDKTANMLTQPRLGEHLSDAEFTERVGCCRSCYDIRAAHHVLQSLHTADAERDHRVLDAFETEHEAVLRGFGIIGPEDTVGESRPSSGAGTAYEAVSVNGRAMEWKGPLWDAINQMCAFQGVKRQRNSWHVAAIENAVEKAMSLALECTSASPSPLKGPDASDLKVFVESLIAEVLNVLAAKPTEEESRRRIRVLIPEIQEILRAGGPDHTRDAADEDESAGQIIVDADEWRESKRDAARLDWLAQQATVLSATFADVGFHYSPEYHDAESRTSHLREKIDAARDASRSSSPPTLWCTGCQQHFAASEIFCDKCDGVGRPLDPDTRSYRTQRIAAIRASRGQEQTTTERSKT